MRLAAVPKVLLVTACLLMLVVSLLLITRVPRLSRGGLTTRSASLKAVHAHQCISTKSPDLRHPACKYHAVAVDAYDLTPALEQLLADRYAVPAVCVFNPSIAHYKGTLFYWTLRLWIIPHGKGCGGPGSEYGPWTRGWFDFNITFLHGQLSLLLDHDPHTGKPLRIVYHQLHANTSARAWEGWPEVVSVSRYREDSRAFKDANGIMRLLHSSRATHSNRTRRPWGLGAHAAEMHVTRLHISQDETSGAYHIDMDDHVALPYKRLHSVGPDDDEKNFVPWSGSAMMSYAYYPWGFNRHSVFDWSDYDTPTYAHDFASTIPVPFFQDLRSLAEARGLARHSHSSGGTPAVPYNGGWLAVGHKVEAASCFHGNLTDPGRPEQCVPERMVEFVCGLTHQPPFTKHAFMKGNHHRSDYFMFFYRFQAHAPYHITHISHAFKLLSQDRTTVHQGVVFPAGLDWLQRTDKLLLSYGEDDSKAKLAVFTSSQLDKMLHSIHEQPRSLEARKYRYCTIPTHEEHMLLPAIDSSAAAAG